ncbi:MAG: glycosyltransferase [Candidatus Moranbacteria bacterium]|nr:glycosyltransferase [bacterium]MDP1833692.1 glycosyltransferase [Candidatus Moranbacteria bacterium]
MKIALVHDYLVQVGGAEKVLECFTEVFPDAPIHTLVYDKKLMHGFFEGKDIRTSFLQNIPFSRKKHRVFPQFMPMAIEQFDFSGYDVVLSDSSSFAKGIITGPETLHICYIHTPMRFAWDDCQKYTEDFYFPSIIKRFIPLVMNYVRIWDRVSADRPDKIIANSKFIARRIKKYYKRDSIVLNPPIDIARFYASENHGDYFLLVGRFMAYKKLDLVVQAFNRTGLQLKIIGRGPEYQKLKEMAKGNIEFLGRVSDEELPGYYARCRAFIFPQEEDFGIVAIEAMASGRPIIAFRGGDIPEHIEEGKTGLFFEEQTAQAIIEAVGKFNDADYDPAYIRGQAEKFDKSLFKARIKEYIDGEYKKFKESN